MIYNYLNYWLAFLLCIAGTIMAALQHSPNAKWLLISDANVAVFLIVAALLDNRRRPNE